jgi:hypothetical protein
MEKLEIKFAQEVKDDTRIVACRFPLPNWEPIQTIGSGNYKNIKAVFIWPHSHILALLQVCLNIILQHLTGSFSLFFILLATHDIYFEHVSSLSLQYELVSVPCFLYSQTVSIPLPLMFL